MKLFIKPKNDSHWHKVFKYEPSTGSLINRTDRGARAKAGEVAGNYGRKDGYVQVGFRGKSYGVHRIIWEMVNGPIPPGLDIDHINGVRNDNRLPNLRIVPRRDNMRNRKRPNTNTNGFIGAHFHKGTGKYQAKIGVSGKATYLGLFDTAEQAHQAYMAAARELGYHKNHGRTV